MADDAFTRKLQRLVTAERLDEAIALLEEHLAEHPDDARLLLKLGDLHAKQGNRPKAIRAYLRAGAIYEGDDATLKAATVYKQVLRLAPDHPRATQRLQALGKEVLSEKDLGKAIRAQLAELARHPDDMRALTRVAELYVQAGEPDAAAAAFLRVAQLYEDEGAALKALAVYKQILRIRPTHQLAAEKAEMLQHAFATRVPVEDPVRDLGKRAYTEALGLYSQGAFPQARERALLARVLMPRAPEVRALLERLSTEK